MLAGTSKPITIRSRRTVCLREDGVSEGRIWVVIVQVGCSCGCTAALPVPSFAEALRVVRTLPAALAAVGVRHA